MSSKSSLIWLGFLVAGATLVTGYVHGRISDRWGHEPEITLGGKSLAKVPDAFGEWKLVQVEELRKETVRMLQCIGYLDRVYEHSTTGHRISVVVLLGPVGPISVHTPEICYSSRDYKISDERQLWELESADGQKHEFWDLRMKSNDIFGSPLRVVYGWTSDDVWHASANPRFEFGGSQYLYKLQLSGPVPDDDSKFDAVRDFLSEFVPALNGSMISSQTTPK